MHQSILFISLLHSSDHHDKETKGVEVVKGDKLCLDLVLTSNTLKMRTFELSDSNLLSVVEYYNTNDTLFS